MHVSVEKTEQLRIEITRFFSFHTIASLPNSYDLIPDILQEPLRGQLAAHPFFFCQLIDTAGAGGELKPLRAGIDEKGDLARVGPSGNLARLEIHKIFEEAAAVVVHRRI